jgi:hypothetical protein
MNVRRGGTSAWIVAVALGASAPRTPAADDWPMVRLDDTKLSRRGYG